MKKNIFINLRDALANLYPDEASIRRITNDSDIDLLHIKFNSTAINNWDSVLREADKVNKVDALLDRVYVEYKENSQFSNASGAYHRSIGQQLQNQPSAIGDRRTIDHLFLPWLVNRNEQLHVFSKVVEQAKRTTKYPIVCLIHGDDDECHDKFVERLEIHSLTNLLPVDPQTPVKRIYLDWPKASNFRNPRELQERLLASLGGEVLNDKFALKGDINDALAKLPGPVLVETNLLIEDGHRQSSKDIDGFLEFWATWPSLGYEQWLIVCLCVRRIKYTPNIWNFWRIRQLNSLNKVVADSSYKASFERFNGIIGVVLPKLEPITRQEIVNWARSPEVRTYCRDRDLITEITSIYRKREFSSPSTSIPMRLLYDELQSILSKHSIV